MNLEKMLEEYRKGTEAVPREEKIAQTVRLSGETFFQMEQERVLSYAEFLKTQFLVLRKRWWVYQCLLLTGAGILLGNMQEGRYMRRSVGVVSVERGVVAGYDECKDIPGGAAAGVGVLVFGGGSGADSVCFPGGEVLRAVSGSRRRGADGRKRDWIKKKG